MPPIFNETFTWRWERVNNFLTLHDVLSRREGADDPTGYWRDQRQDGMIPGRLHGLLAPRTHRPPSRHEFNRIQEVFPAASYQYILYGMGFRPEPGLARRDRAGEGNGEMADRFFRLTADLTRKVGRRCPTSARSSHTSCAMGCTSINDNR